MNTINISSNKAYFMLPGFCEHYQVYKTINKFLDTYPEAKRENAEVYCYYGNIPFCTWDGGRIFNEYYPLTIEKIQELKDYYNNEIKSKIRLVFTNSLLKPEHLDERYNNLVLNIFHEGNNEIVLNSTILENYLNEYYPQYSLIASTTKCSNAKNSKEDLNKNYKFVCLDYNLNHNWNFLNSLSNEEKMKTEFLVNPICGIACPQRKEHYRLNSLFSLTYGQHYPMKHCVIKEINNCAILNKAHITVDEIYNLYVPSGFNFFKLEGRTWPSQDIAVIYSEYLINNEYQSFFLRHVLNELNVEE